MLKMFQYTPETTPNISYSYENWSEKQVSSSIRISINALPGSTFRAQKKHPLKARGEKNGRPKKAAFCQKFMIFNKSQNIVTQAKRGDQKTYCEAVYIIFRGEQISSTFMLRLVQESVVFYMLPFFKQMCMFYCCLNEQCRLLIL